VIAKLPRVRFLSQRALAVLVELVRWREAEAEARDEPRGYVLADPMLVEIARRAPKKPEDLSTLRGLAPRFVERHGKSLVRAVARAATLPDAELPSLPAARHEDPFRAAAVDLLDVFLKQRAVDEEIAPRYIGTKQDIADLVAAYASGAVAVHREGGAAPCALLAGWRYDLMGRDAIAILEGKVDLGLNPRTGAVTVRPRARSGGSA
jgi:ribonuclease D